MKPTLQILLTGLLGTLSAAALADDLGYTDTPIIPGTKWHVHDSGRPQPTVITPGAASTQEKAGTARSEEHTSELQSLV